MAIVHFIYPFIDGHLDWSHFLAIKKLLWTFMHKFLGGNAFSFLLGIYLGMKLLGHMVPQCLTFLGIARQFSKMSISCYNLTGNV